MKVLSGKVSYYSGWIINHKRIFADGITAQRDNLQDVKFEE